MDIKELKKVRKQMLDDWLKSCPFVFVNTTLGATPNPWPIVAPPVAVPVYVTILNPAVVLAWTVEVIEPEELLDVVPPLAFHWYAT